MTGKNIGCNKTYTYEVVHSDGKSHTWRSNCDLLRGHVGNCAAYSSSYGEWSGNPDPGAADAALDAMNEADIMKLWEQIVPPRFVDLRVDDLDQPDDVKACIAAWWGPDTPPAEDVELPDNLLFFGPIGSGKTFASLTVARTWVEENMRADVKFITGADLLASLRPGGEGTLDQYIRPTILILDDLGATKLSEWSEEIWTTILDGRWRNNRSTIATSNLSPEELEVNIGRRAWDRLRHNAIAVNIPGPSRRKSAS